MICKGEHVLTVSGTQDEYQVEIWSGNHPLFQKGEIKKPIDDGPLSRFNKKYAELEELTAIPTLEGNEVEGLELYKKKQPKKKK